MEELAVQTFDLLAKEGVTVSPVDAVRIDAAARRLREAKSSDGACFLAAPRVRFCGGVLFHEPTVQSDIWLSEVAAPLCADGRTAIMLRAFALVHADEPGFFDAPEMRTARTVQRAAKSLMRTIAATKDEVVAAMDYCINGDEADIFDEPPPPGRGRSPSGPQRTYRDRLYEDLAEAVGVSGAAIDDLKRLTPPMLERAIRRAYELNRWEFRDTAGARALVAWNALLAEVRGRHYDEQERMKADAASAKTASATATRHPDGVERSTSTSSMTGGL